MSQQQAASIVFPQWFNHSISVPDSDNKALLAFSQNWVDQYAKQFPKPHSPQVYSVVPQSLNDQHDDEQQDSDQKDTQQPKVFVARTNFGPTQLIHELNLQLKWQRNSNGLVSGQDVLEFWFEGLVLANPKQVNSSYKFQQVDNGWGFKTGWPRWFGKNPELDWLIQTRFQHTLETLMQDRKLQDEWIGAGEKHSQTLALILLIDQFSRNMYRDDPQTYANDERARELTHGLLKDRECYQKLRPIEKSFVLLPLMHSELVAEQQLCITEFQKLADEAHPDNRPEYNGSVKYARDHCKVIQKYGRFPHRNKILGRPNTKEEEEYLKDNSGW